MNVSKLYFWRVRPSRVPTSLKVKMNLDWRRKNENEIERSVKYDVTKCPHQSHRDALVFNHVTIEGQVVNLWPRKHLLFYNLPPERNQKCIASKINQNKGSNIKSYKQLNLTNSSHITQLQLEYTWVIYFT